MIPILFCATLAIPLEDLPFLDPGTTVYQVSSHNKRGLNGDGGWYLHDGAADVEAPAGFFFGAGVRWQDIPSLAIGIRGDEGYCHLPMPFWESARIRLQNRGPRPASRIGYAVAWRAEPYPAERAGYFRTRFQEGPTSRGRDWIFLQTEGQGQYVGVVHRLIGGHYCEGDIRFYIDGSRSPAFYGTGTEDYYHQACWPNTDNHTPFHGCVGDVAEEAKGAPGKTFHDFPLSMEARWEFKDQDFTLEWIPTGDDPVAFIEILSSGNKPSRTTLDRFRDKTIRLLAGGSHMSLIDILPPGHPDPHDIPGVGDEALIAGCCEEAGGAVASRSASSRRSAAGSSTAA